MRFSAVAALCAAPLALAGTLQHDLAARGAAGVEMELSTREESKSNNEKGNSQKNNNNDNGNTVLVQQSQVNEVIVIWFNNGGGAATQTVTDTVTVTQNGGSGTATAAAAAATHTVTVGGPAGLVYSPESIEAAVGDMVIFTFLSNNHTATQSAFTEPCKKIADGMDSGFMANVNNTVSPPPQMAMQVTVATPIWFYCRQKNHCGQGMTFSINPTANKTQAMFKQMAIAQNGTGAASPITGGTASSAVAPPAASVTESAAAAPSATESASAAAAAATGLVAGSGTINAGACECACLCGVAAFPNVDIQGIGAFGGMSGAMPMASLEA